MAVWYRPGRRRPCVPVERAARIRRPMNHILCPGCDTVITITEFPCPNCGRCSGCGRWSNSMARECTRCRHPNAEQIAQRLLSKFGIPEPSVAQARRCASNLGRLRRVHVISFRIAVAVCGALVLCFLEAVGGIFLMLVAALVVGSLELTFGILEFLQRRAITSLRDNQ